MKLEHTIIMATAVLAVAACKPSEGMTANGPVKACMYTDSDGYNQRVSDSSCNTARAGGAYGWYYMNRGAYVPSVGESFDQSVGSNRPAMGASYAAAPESVSVARGGLGTTARSVSVGE